MRVPCCYYLLITSCEIHAMPEIIDKNLKQWEWTEVKTSKTQPTAKCTNIDADRRLLATSSVQTYVLRKSLYLELTKKIIWKKYEIYTVTSKKSLGNFMTQLPLSMYVYGFLYIIPICWSQNKLSSDFVRIHSVEIVAVRMNGTRHSVDRSVGRSVKVIYYDGWHRTRWQLVCMCASLYACKL